MNNVPRIFTEAFMHMYNRFKTGTLLEFGVGSGNSYLQQVFLMNMFSVNYTLIGFDSFEGLPDEQNSVWRPEHWHKGAFKYSKDVLTERLMQEFGRVIDGKQLRLVEGWYENTLTKELQQSLNNVVFINVDVDLYASAMEVLRFVRPLLQEGTVIYFDDWKDPTFNPPSADSEWGEHLAMGHWLAENPRLVMQKVAANTLNQCFWEVLKCS